MPFLLPKLEQVIMLGEGTARISNNYHVPMGEISHPFEVDLDLLHVNPLCLALSTPSVSEKFNYERLEFWGFVILF